MTTQSASFVLPSAPAPRQTPQLPPPIDPSKALAARQRAQALEAKRKAQHEIEMLSLEYSKILWAKHIHEALDEKTDPRLRRDLRNDVLNRGIGRVRDEDANEAEQRKKVDARSVLDMLAAISSANNQRAGIGHTPAAPVPIERDVTPIEHDPDAQWFEQYPSSTEVDDHE